MTTSPKPNRWLRRTSSALVLVLLAVFAIEPVTGRAASREYDLKAAFLYNFATFGEWPQSAFASASSPFVIGVLGPDPFGSALEEIVVGERIKGRPIVIRRFERPEQALQGCQILFVSAAEKRHLREILSVVRDRPILTVADLPGFVESGGLIGFTTSARIGIQVNPVALRAANLNISPKLLRLAEVVAVNSPP
ncbi:MAG: YfiR family protein [Verrucomicrobia bacterium]|nr:YfiR family protein [Verrucomicrobiota bacterium]